MIFKPRQAGTKDLVMFVASNTCDPVPLLKGEAGRDSGVVVIPLGPVVPDARPESPTEASISRHKRLTRKDQRLLANQTYAPASLGNKPTLLRDYSLLFNEFGGSRPCTVPMSKIASALNCSERTARNRVNALKAAGVLRVERRPGQESQYQLLQERKYVELPLALVLLGSCAVCAVWGALRRTIGRGRSALRCVTAVTQVAWAAIQRITGLCRTVVAEALRWLRKHRWLARRVVWASLRPIRRAVCRWRLFLRTPAEMRTPPRQESGQLPSGGSGDYVEPPAGPYSNPGVGEKALKDARESGAEGVDLLTEWRRRVEMAPS